MKILQSAKVSEVKNYIIKNNTDKLWFLHPIVFKENVIKNIPLARVHTSKNDFEGLLKLGIYLPKVSEKL
jgi:hypothetical protein